MLKATSKNLLKTCSFSALTLALIAGCGDAGKKATGSSSTTTASSDSAGAVLCKINGKAVINEAEFNSNINQMLQANPYFKGAGAQSLPLSIKRKFFDELVKQELIIADATKNNLEQDPEFRKALDDMQKLVKRSLVVQFFEKGIYDAIVIEDSEIKKHFEENKERYVKSPGGVLVGAVKFDSEKAADAFEAKSSSAQTYADFEKAAKDKNAQFRSFGRISKQEGKNFQFENVPAQIRDAVLSAKALPFISKVKVGKDFWIVHASDKRDAEMFDFAEIKPQMVNMLKNNKFREKLDQAINDLRTKTSIDINEDFFKEKKSNGVTEQGPAEAVAQQGPAVGA